MKLTLKNFKCHTEKVFEFEDIGLMLIFGDSGAGKSTILNSFLFVLYGIGKKIQTFGNTKTSSVELEYNNLKIVRTKSPNNLVLYENDKEYEDDIAQNIINKYFGNAFDVVSYLQQKNINSFIYKNPTEKLEFLESFAFKDINLQNIKERCKTEINQRKEDYNKIINQLEITKNIFNEMEIPEKIDFPLKGKKPIEILIKEEEIRYKNCEIRIKKSNSNINKLQKELNDLLILTTSIKEKNYGIDNLIIELEELNLNEDELEYEGENNLNDYKLRLENVLFKKELLQLEKKYLEDSEKLILMEENEIKKYKKELKNIEDSLWNEYSKDELPETINNLKECLNDAKEVSELKNQNLKYNINIENLNDNKSKLEKYKLELEEKNNILDMINKQNKIYNCPSCNTKLNFINNELCINNELMNINENIDIINIENIKDDIINIKKNIKVLENNIPEQEIKLKNKNINDKRIIELVSQYENEDELNENNILDDIENLKEYNKIQFKLENRKIEIEKILIENNFSSSFVMFKKDLNELKNKIAKLVNKYGENDEILEEETLRSYINKGETNKREIEKNIKKKKTIEENKTKYIDSIQQLKDKHIEKYNSIKNVDDIHLEIKTNENIIKENNKNKVEHYNSLDNVKKYNVYKDEYSKYLNFKNKITEMEEKEVEYKKRYNASLLLKEKLLEAESIAIYNIIENINMHAQIYLDYFFQDNPIIVKLLTFKETKKNNKPQINIEIDYKGNECDLDSLSGGELQRVNLAFTLALSELFNSPILLLDECTSNLNQELTNIVFEAIKDNFKDKIILIVAHQVVTGIFDKIIYV